MPGEIQTYDDAKERLETFFDFTDKQSELEDYAKIAEFLSSRDAFTKALDTLSKKLWELYRNYDSSRRGKFSLSINTQAARYGFMNHDHRTINTTGAVLVAGIDAEQFIQLVKDGIFWKDEMDLKHGEFSHTFQWLAIAVARGQGLELKKSAAHLYKRIFDIHPSSSDIHVPGFKREGQGRQPDGAKKGVVLWSWLVDGFLNSMASGGAPPADKESLFTNSFRSPQRVMQYLLDDTDKDTHFLGAYLAYRYYKRSWFKPGEEMKYEFVSGGQTAKVHGRQKHENNPRWTPIKSHNSGETVAYKRAQTEGFHGNFADHCSVAQTKKYEKNLMEVTFHEIEGKLSNPYVLG